MSSDLDSTVSATYSQTFRIPMCQSRGIAVQCSTLCLSGTHRPFRGLWHFLSWVLAFVCGAQGHIAGPAVMECEEVTAESFLLPNRFYFFP